MLSVERRGGSCSNRSIVVWWFATLVALSSASFADSAVDQSRVVVDLDTPLAVVQPSFFGFNVEWITFQASALDSSGAVRAPLVEALKVFRGAHYRYPGGTASNHFDWRRAFGPLGERPLQDTPWSSGRRMQFGIAEYLDFVRSVGGRPWYVLNVTPAACRSDNASRTDCLESVKDSARDLAAEFQRMQGGLGAAGKSTEGCEVGGPCPIAVWEIGNETDHGKAAISSERYIELSRAAISGIRAVQQDSYIVAHTATSPWDAGRRRESAEFNSRVISSLSARNIGFSYHLYYDGISTASAISFLDLGDPGRQLNDKWVTEHAKWPKEDPYTHRFSVEAGPTNFGAALSNADFMLKLSRRPNVKGAMAHALDGIGPWPMFQVKRDGSGIVTTPVFDVLALLRKNMVGEVISTRTISGRVPGEVQAYRDKSTQRISVVVVHRGDREQSMNISLQGTTGNFQPPVEACVMREDSRDCLKSIDDIRAMFKYSRNADRSVMLNIPPRSVVVLSFGRS
jgi:alpha-L-arabinofuranosidase